MVSPHTPSKRRSTMKTFTWLRTLIVLGIAAALCLSAACRPAATPTPVEEIADEIDDLVGVWQVSQLIQDEFLADGTVKMHEFLGKVGSVTRLTGEFWFEGTVLNLADSVCDERGTYEVWLVKEGGKTVALRWKVIEDSCPSRRAVHQGLTKRASSD
jgi:hypothetical protein